MESAEMDQGTCDVGGAVGNLDKCLDRRQGKSRRFDVLFFCRVAACVCRAEFCAQGGGAGEWRGRTVFHVSPGTGCTPVTSRGQKAQLRQAQAPQPRHRRQDVNGRDVFGVAAAAPPTTFHLRIDDTQPCRRNRQRAATATRHGRPAARPELAVQCVDQCTILFFNLQTAKETNPSLFHS